MKNLNLFLILALSLIIYSCEKELDKGTNLNLEKLTGFVQKGPFINGTSITISELTSDLIQTGKTFNTQISDNKGSFELKHIELSSQFVELKADGFYFNEVNNTNSSAQLTLFALSDLSDKSSLNVNVLTNLEKNRVDYLVSNGMSFSQAKNQAQTEILSIFKISNNSIFKSEQLDITKTGDDNAILLAVSVILQGYLSVSDLSELLANLSTDIREDGQLNSQSLSSKLINNAKTIKLETIRKNLESRYEELGLNITIPDFEKYVNLFIDSTDFEFTGFIEYPATGKHGINILDKEKIDYNAGTYSMKAILPEGTSLKVKISGQNWFFPAFQNNSGWEHSDWNDSDNSRIFTATKTGEIDFEILFGSYQDIAWSNKIDIFVYENEDLNPTWTKEISVINEYLEAITYPVEGNYGNNLLAMENKQIIEKDLYYSIAAFFPSDIALKIRLKMNVIEEDITWIVDEAKQVNWTGIPTAGNEIVAQALGELADMPIIFSGTGVLEVQVETTEVGGSEKYLGTKRIELTIK